MKGKIGAAIITCKRQQFFEKCVNSLPPVDKLVVVNDGDAYSNSVYPSKVTELIQHTRSKSVGLSKNEALRYLMQNDITYLFLIEDDMLIKRQDIFEAYIKAGAKSGIQHLNFSQHGAANKKPDGSKNPREVIDYGDGVEIGLYPNGVGSFSFYHKGIIKNVGYIDEHFSGNSWDHISHTLSIIEKGLHPPFWWFADLANSEEYIDEQGTVDTTSVIRKSEEWMRNMQIGAGWFKHKHRFYPTQMPDTPKEKVLMILETLQKNFSRDFSLL